MKLKRNPGEWLQKKRSDSIFDVGLYASMAYGWLCGAGLTLLMVFVIRFSQEQIFLGMLLPSLLLFIFAWYKYKSGWRLKDMEKGELADLRMVTRPGALANHINVGKST